MKHNSFFRTTALAVMLALLTALVAFAGIALAQEESPPPLHDGVQWSGVLDSFSDTEWTVAGQAVGVTADTHIRVTGVLATGMWVEVQAVRADDTLTARRLVANSPAMSLRGQVSVLPDGGIGEWIIGGQAFQVTADTTINDRGGPIVVDSWVQVVALQQGTTLVAQRIRSIHALPAVEVMGALQAVSATQWTVSGVDIALNSDTIVNGEPRVGLLVQAASELQDDNSLLALRARVMWHEQGSGQEPATLTGLIEALPTAGLIGQWVVEDVTVVVGRNTRINQQAGLVAVGAEVRIVGQEVANGALAAREIVVVNSPISGEAVRFGGVIETMPASGLIGEWMIGGQTVQVTAATQIVNPRQMRVGARVQVTGLRQSSGVVIATELAARSPRPGEGSVDFSADTVTE